MKKRFALRAALTGALLLSPAAFAQYRPPPTTEAERMVHSGDDARDEGTKALAKGDKETARERLGYALGKYKEALKADPNLLSAGIGIGESASLLSDYKSVVELLGPMAKQHPESVELAYFVGVAHLKLQHNNEALPLLQVVSKADRPEHLIVHFYLGRLDLQLGQAEEAVVELGKYLQQRPAKLAANDGEVQLLLGHAQLRLRRPKEARAAFEAAQRGRPEALQLQMGLEAVLEQEGRIDDALKQLEGLAQRFPKSPEPRERMGWLLLSKNELPKAEAAAQSAIALGESATNRHLLGEIRFAQKRYANAEPDLRRAAQLAPTYLQPQFTLARALQAQGRNDDAIGLLENVVKGGMKQAEVYAALGSTYRRAGRFQEAVATHTKVVEMQPGSALGPTLLGADYYATGQWDPAIKQYETALTVDSNNANARKWLSLALAHRAQALARANQLADASRDLRRALDLNRTAALARSLAAVLLTQNQSADAATVLEKNTGLPGADWRDSFLLGYALLGGGRAADAVAAFEKAGTATADTAIRSDIYAGWALAKLELGDFDAAVAKLTEPTESKSASKLAGRNLPLALVRRALDRLRQGDSEGAAKDIDAAEKLAGDSGDLVRLARFARALQLSADGKDADAQKLLRKAFTGAAASWALPNSSVLASAYLAYRADGINAARKLEAQAKKKKGSDAQGPWLVQFDRALDRREGELAYNKGSMRDAEKIFKRTLADDPLNAHLINNLACVSYRSGKAQDAVASWTKVANTIPAAQLNLGIDSQLRRKNYQAAVDYYARYVAQGRGSRIGQAREWKNHLEQIYGLSAAATATDEAPAQAEGQTEQKNDSAADRGTP